jgi:hypothetical protein
MIINNYRKKNNKLFNISLFKKIKIIIIYFIIIILLFLILNNGINFYSTENNIEYAQYNSTLVSAFYIMDSKHSLFSYINWLNNLLKLNSPIVFFTEKAFMKIAKNLRPKNLYNKTIFIEMEMKDFFSYQNYGKYFIKSFDFDPENSYHSIPLYLIWAEKCMFLKKVINNNYFNTKCFYWIDSGWFRESKEMSKFVNNWPSPKICYNDDRVLINLVRKFSDEEIIDIRNFNLPALKNLQKRINVAGGMFGGRPEKLIKFIDLYYKSIDEYVQHNLFIGKDQNLFTYISFSHPDIVKLAFSKGNYFFFKKYLS